MDDDPTNGVVPLSLQEAELLGEKVAGWMDRAMAAARAEERERITAAVEALARRLYDDVVVANRYSEHTLNAARQIATDLRAATAQLADTDKAADDD